MSINITNKISANLIGENILFSLFLKLLVSFIKKYINKQTNTYQHLTCKQQNPLWQAYTGTEYSEDFRCLSVSGLGGVANSSNDGQSCATRLAWWGICRCLCCHLYQQNWDQATLRTGFPPLLRKKVSYGCLWLGKRFSWKLFWDGGFIVWEIIKI